MTKRKNKLIHRALIAKLPKSKITSEDRKRFSELFVSGWESWEFSEIRAGRSTLNGRTWDLIKYLYEKGIYPDYLMGHAEAELKRKRNND
jgi:hypothetical protein